LEPLEYVNVLEIPGYMSVTYIHSPGNIPLRKPRRSDNSQLCLDCAKVLRTITNDHYRLLHRTPRHLGRPIDKFTRIQLSRTRYAEKGGSGVRGGLGAMKRKVRVVFGGGMRAIAQCHEGEQGPVVVDGGISAFFGAEP